GYRPLGIDAVVVGRVLALPAPVDAFAVWPLPLARSERDPRRSNDFHACLGGNRAVGVLRPEFVGAGRAGLDLELALGGGILVKHSSARVQDLHARRPPDPPPQGDCVSAAPLRAR